MRFQCQKCGFENEVVSDFHQKGGKARMSSISKEERKKNALKAARTKKKRREADGQAS